jgi:hypothetical protein
MRHLVYTLLDLTNEVRVALPKKALARAACGDAVLRRSRGRPSCDHCRCDVEATR